MMKSKAFVDALVNIAKNFKTLYVMGCFGAPMNSGNKTRYCNNHKYNRQAARTAMIKAATSDTFGFDCVCLIKGVLWGWTGDTSKSYGGAAYASNGVPDIGAEDLHREKGGQSVEDRVGASGKRRALAGNPEGERPNVHDYSRGTSPENP